MPSGFYAGLQARHKKRAIVLSAGAILVGAALFLYGEWTVGTGTEGVIHYLLQTTGIGLVGAACLTIDMVFTGQALIGFRGRGSAERREIIRQAGKQCLVVVLNVFVYGSVFILAMGGISALDHGNIITAIVVLFLWVLCIIIFIAYRRYRKEHKVGYSVIGTLGVSLILLLIGAGMLYLGVSGTANAAQDLKDGPRTADVFIVDARLDNPYWKYRLIKQPEHVLTFYTADEERIVLEVHDTDIDSAKIINDLGNFVHLTYYPRTQIFCDATRWDNGKQVMGQDLLTDLQESYGFQMP